MAEKVTVSLLFGRRSRAENSGNDILSPISAISSVTDFQSLKVGIKTAEQIADSSNEERE
jgi:hypothetical protein